MTVFTRSSVGVLGDNCWSKSANAVDQGRSRASTHQEILVSTPAYTSIDYERSRCGSRRLETEYPYEEGGMYNVSMAFDGAGTTQTSRIGKFCPP